MSEKIILQIDGRQVISRKGESIFNAARNSGIEIPHLCYHKNLFTGASCRLCLVEVEGARNLIASCAYPVSDGMKVWTNTQRVRNARKMILELLLSDHPADCIICEKNGDCKLQDYAYEYNIKDIRFSGEKRKFSPEDGNPFLIRDNEKCILCGRCVSVCQQVMQTYAIDFSNRGFRTKITTAFDMPLLESGCVQCGNCIEVCPVGALREKQAEGKGRSWEFKKVKTICPYCGVGCNIILHIKNNEVVKVTSWAESPVNSGWLCAKGKFGFEFINHPERLKKPLIRQRLGNRGQRSEFKETTWEEALDFVANKFKKIKEEYGADAIAGIASAKCTNEENYLFQKFFRAAVGTNNVDHCARLCHAPSVVALNMTVGSGAMTNSLDDVRDISDVLFVIGDNPTETHPITALKIKYAVLNRGARLIVADPRKIDLTDIADVHLQQIPGTDVALLQGMAKVIIEEGLQNDEFIKSRCENFDEFKKSIDDIDLDWVEKVTGVDKEKIKDAARIYARGKASIILWGMGITQHTTGVDNALMLSNLALLTGHIGREGAGLCPLRGQNNVQGACDMGCLPNLYPCYMSVADENIKSKMESLWSAKLSTKAGMTMIEMIKAILDGKIKALYIMGENPLLSDPDINHVREAFEKIEFLVVQDIFLTETAKYADVVFPAASFAEKDGTFTNTERKVQRVRKALISPGEAKPDWEIICELSKKMNYEMKYTSPEEIMKEIAALSPLYCGINYEKIDAEGVCWPCPTQDHTGTKTLHKEKFSRGLGKFIAVKFKEASEPPSDEYPLVLTTGRTLYQYHTGSMTRRVKGLESLSPECLVEINPTDARKYKVSDGQKVKITSRRGSIEAKVLVTEKVPEGVIFIPFHYQEAAANILTGSSCDPVSKTPELKKCAVRIENL